MAYKVSLFNYVSNNICENPQNVFVFNTLSRKLIQLPQRFLENLSSVDEKTLLELKNSGIVVDEMCDEISAIETFITEQKYSQKRLMLTIIPTNACNFKCVYCYQPIRSSYMNDETVDSILKWLSQNLRFYEELNLSWFGGEPLLCRDLMIKLMKEIKALCKKNGVAMISSVTTNGYLLDVETFKTLVHYGLLFYQITIDGEREMHNQQRPHKIKADSYDVILKNLIEIKKLPSKIRFEIGLRINVSGKMSSESIYHYIDEMQKIFGDDKRFVFIWQWVRDWGGSRLTKDLVKESTDCLNYIEYAAQKGLHMPKLISITCGTDSCEAFYKSGYVINHNGMVYKCAMCMEDHSANCIGEITSNGKMVIEQEKEARWMRRDSIEGKCQVCALLPMCLSNRCHYSVKIQSKLKCMEYKDLVDAQIGDLIEMKEFHIIGGNL